MATSTNILRFKSGRADVNGIAMYYEIYGQGQPLVLIHGGGSTIQTSFGNVIPLLGKRRQLIGLELQAHGRTDDRNADLTFEQDAEDVARLLAHLKIPKADFLGFSNGGQTAIEMGIRHSGLVNKLILASTFYKRSAVPDQFWEGFDKASLKDMPQALKEEQLKANGNDREALLNMFTKDVQRMKTFTGWTEEQMKSIEAPTLVINADKDVSSPEHAVEMYRLIPRCELAIFPGGHGAYLGAAESLDNGRWTSFNAAALIDEFLSKS